MASSIFKRMNVDNCFYYKTTYFFLLADYFRVKLFLKFVSYNQEYTKGVYACTINGNVDIVLFGNN